ncbi:MAG: hypothetical protein AB2L18_04630 [Anaerolineaceae bacterium]
MKQWMFWIGILISGLLLYLAIRGLNLNNPWNSIKTINIIWLPITIVGLLFFIRERLHWNQIKSQKY